MTTMLLDIHAVTRLPAARRDLMLLLIASGAAILTLMLGFDDSAGDSLAARVRTGGLAVVLACAAYAALLLNARARETADASVTGARREVDELRRRLIAAEAMVRAEPQVLLFWERAEGFRIATHTLVTVPGLPTRGEELLAFGTWLEPAAAAELGPALAALFETGRAFTLILRTAVGGHLEADGRATGGAAVLRLRDIAGHKLDLMRIIEQHRHLTAEIRAGRAALDALPTPVWIRAADGRLQWVNKAYAKAVEATDPVEAVARGIELLASRERAEIEGQANGGGDARRGAARVQLVVGGERRPHDVSIEPIDGASVGIAIDMTAADAARGRLDLELKSFDATLDKVTDAVAIFGPDQRLIYCNQAYTTLWQLDRAWLGEHRPEGEILDRLRERSRLPAAVNWRDWKKQWLSIYQTGQPIEDWWHLADTRTIHVLGEPRPDGGVVYVFEDASERLALESRYRTLIKVQRETLDGLKEAVAVFAPDGRLKLSNAGFGAIWGLSKAELDQGPHISDVIAKATRRFDDQQTWGSIAALVTSFAEGRETVAGDMRLTDGTVVEFAGLPLPDGGTLLSFMDMTTARDYERALVERNEALVSADRLKTEFISHVSYELRTPLTNIIGFGDLMALPRTGPLNTRQRDYIGDMQTSSRTLLAIIDDILDLATIDAGALELRLASSSVRDIIAEAIAGVTERAKRDGIAIDVDVAADVETYVCDSARARQVLYNLLSNAIGFSSAGQTVRVLCRREVAAEGRARIVFTVVDEGPGIASEQQARIFERFVTHNQSAKHRGVGLGLAIVRSLVELHGGEATLESEPGHGTRVSVSFPDIEVPEPEPEPPAPLATAASSTATPSADSSAPKRRRKRKA